MFIFAGLIALQPVQAQPLTKVTSAQAVAPSVRLTPKLQLQSNAETLVAHAKTFSSSYTPRPGQPTKAELDAAIAAAKSAIDSQSEMGETESLRLQMAMDRVSKMTSTLSNILKKCGDTSQGITQNIK